MSGFFGKLFDLNNDGELDDFEKFVDFATFMDIIEDDKNTNSKDDFDDLDFDESNNRYDDFNDEFDEFDDGFEDIDYENVDFDDDF